MSGLASQIRFPRAAKLALGIWARGYNGTDRENSQYEVVSSPSITLRRPCEVARTNDGNSVLVLATFSEPQRLCLVVPASSSLSQCDGQWRAARRALVCFLSFFVQNAAQDAGASSRLAHSAACCRHWGLGRQPKKSVETVQMGVVTAQASLGLASCPRGHPSSVHSEHSPPGRGANGWARPVTLRC